MDRWLTCASVTAGVLLSVTAAYGLAQGGQFRGKVTDEWGNGLEGALVTAQSSAGGAPRETTTDENGEFLFIGMSGEWVFEFRTDGYQGARMETRLRGLNTNRPTEVSLQVFPSGERFRSDTEFEAEGGTPKIKFDEDGMFEFEDANGGGEGTYGIVELSAVMVIRDYDGPDDTYSVNEPVVVMFADDQFTSLTWSDTSLVKK